MDITNDVRDSASQTELLPARRRLKVIAIGHSHLGSLLEGARALGEGGPDARFFQLYLPAYQPLTRWEGNSLRYNETLIAELAGAIADMKPDVLVTSPIGSEHYIWAIAGQVRPFDVILPFAPDEPRDDGAELIPYALLRQYYEDAIGMYLRLPVHLAETFGLRVLQPLPPPPVADGSRLARCSPSPYAAQVEALGAPSDVVRRKLWLVWRETARALIQNSSVELIEPPAVALDEGGMLIQDYYSTDAVHANQWYGALVWHQVTNAMHVGS